MSNEVKFSLITPTRQRPDLVKEFLDSFFGKAAHPDEVEVLFAADFDDETAPEIEFFALEKKYNVKILKRHRSNWHQRDYNSPLARLATGNYIWGCNDENLIVQDNWDSILEAEIEAFLADKLDRVVYVAVGDGTHDESNPNTHRREESGCCFPILTKEAIAALGCWMPIEIQAWSGDIHLFNIFRGLNYNRVLNLREEIQVIHRSSHNGLREKDYSYQNLADISTRCTLTEEEYFKYISRLNNCIDAQSK